MDTPLLRYYEAIEQASADMLLAAQRGDWEQVLKLEGTCGTLISQLKHAAQVRPLAPEQARIKERILQRILSYDAQIRSLADPALDGLTVLLNGASHTVH